MKNKLPSAFPHFKVDEDGKMFVDSNMTGMSLRDYFANSAMQSFIQLQPQYGYTNIQISQMAYDQADLMLKQREL